MLRIISSFGLTLFLFAALIGTVNVLISSQTFNEQNVIAKVSEKIDNRLSIKEIEVISSDNNYYFTAANALR